MVTYLLPFPAFEMGWQLWMHVWDGLDRQAKFDSLGHIRILALAAFVWAILAGMLWAVANTLTVFAIRDVGISIAFPLWNTNSLVGLLWGWLLFRELRGATY